MTLNELLKTVPEADRDLPLCISRTLGTSEVASASVEDGGVYSEPDGTIRETRVVILHPQ